MKTGMETKLANINGGCRRSNLR